ncbi:MAG: serine hydrolase domain-containing protein [Planctomycetaceae bacterium]
MNLFRACIPVMLVALVTCSAGSASGQVARLAPVLQPFVDSHSLAGAVALVAGKDRVLATEAVGFADVAAGRPMAADSIFWIASMSKPITAAAVMVLVDEGKVAIDDPVEKHLPEFRGQMVAVYEDDATRLLKKPRHPITVRNVLAHTSGLPFASSIEQPTLDGRSLEVATVSYALTPLLFEPDTRYLYSNAGINTAGRIVEVLSAMPFERFVEERLFKPLGMVDTTFWPDDAQMARLAKSYRPKPESPVPALEEMAIKQLRQPLTDRVSRHPMPAGGYFSTAADVGRFCRMLLGGGEMEGRRVLSAEAVREMTSRQTPADVKESYGLGFTVNGTSFGHGGAHATNMSIDPATGIATVWMVQHAGFPGDGAKAQGEFQKAATAAFGRQK